MIFCHHFSFMEEIYFWSSLYCTIPEVLSKLNYFKNEMEGSLFKEKLSVPSVSTSSFAPAPNTAVCFVFLLFLHDGSDPSWQQPPVYLLSSQKHLRLLTLSSLLTSYRAFKALLSASPLLILLHLSFFWKSFILFAPLSLVFLQQDSILVLIFPVHGHQAQTRKLPYLMSQPIPIYWCVHYLPSALKV